MDDDNAVEQKHSSYQSLELAQLIQRQRLWQNMKRFPAAELSYREYISSMDVVLLSTQTTPSGINRREYKCKLANEFDCRYRVLTFTTLSEVVFYDRYQHDHGDEEVVEVPKKNKKKEASVEKVASKSPPATNEERADADDVADFDDPVPMEINDEIVCVPTSSKTSNNQRDEGLPFLKLNFTLATSVRSPLPTSKSRDPSYDFDIDWQDLDSPINMNPPSIPLEDTDNKFMDETLVPSVAVPLNQLPNLTLPIPSSRTSSVDKPLPKPSISRAFNGLDQSSNLVKPGRLERANMMDLYGIACDFELIFVVENCEKGTVSFKKASRSVTFEINGNIIKLLYHDGSQQRKDYWPMTTWDRYLTAIRTKCVAYLCV